jgi:hypothetical protein
MAGLAGDEDAPRLLAGRYPSLSFHDLISANEMVLNEVGPT